MSNYYTACVCLNGHLITEAAEYGSATPYCSQCGEETVQACPSCKAALRGRYEGSMSLSAGDVHAYCLNCGIALPWTDRNLAGVAELAAAIEELTSHERDTLKELMPHLLDDTPRTAAAGFKIGVIVAKLGPGVRAVLKDAIVSIAADAGKKALGLT